MEENTTTIDIQAVNDKIAQESAFIDMLVPEINKVIVGQKHMVERLLIGLLGKGQRPAGWVDNVESRRMPGLPSLRWSPRPRRSR